MQKRRLNSKIKLTVYLSRAMADRLDLACKDPSKNKSKLTERALAQLLDPAFQSQRDGGLSRGLQQVNRQVALVERHQQVVLESLGLFIRYFLTVTPPLPRSEQDAARAKGHQRFEAFIMQLGKRLAGSSSLVGEMMEKLAHHDPDLLVRDLDDAVFDNVSRQKPSAPGAPVPERGGEDPVPVEMSSASSRSALAPGASPRNEGAPRG